MKKIAALSLVLALCLSAVCAFAAAMLIDLFALRLSTIVIMLAAAVTSLIVYAVRRGKEKEAQK